MNERRENDKMWNGKYIAELLEYCTIVVITLYFTMIYLGKVLHRLLVL